MFMDRDDTMAAFADVVSSSAHRAVVANVGLVRHVRRIHDIGARVRLAEVERVGGDELARERLRLGVEREALGELEGLAMNQAARERPCANADRVHDEYVVLPAPDRMTGEARLEVLGMLGLVDRKSV